MLSGTSWVIACQKDLETSNKRDSSFVSYEQEFEHNVNIGRIYTLETHYVRHGQRNVRSDRLM
jgi:hypothetical protein